MLSLLILALFPACMIHAAATDILSMTIANRVSIALIAGFAALAPLTGMDWATYGMHFAAAAIVLCVSFAVFALGGMGGGDAKLLTATALWTGLGPALSNYLVVSAFTGGVLTVLIVLYRRSPLAASTGHVRLLRNFANPKEGIPYGVALAIGGLVVFPHTPLAIWALAKL